MEKSYWAKPAGLFTILVGLCTIVGAIATVIVVPEVRKGLGLAVESTPPAKSTPTQTPAMPSPTIPPASSRPTPRQYPQLTTETEPLVAIRATPVPEERAPELLMPQVKTIHVRMEPVESLIKNDSNNPVIYLWVTKVELRKTNTTLTLSVKSTDPQRGCYLYPPVMQSSKNDPPLEPRFQPAYLVDQDGTSYFFISCRGIDFSVYPTTSWTQQYVHFIPPAVAVKFQMVFRGVGDAATVRKLKLYYDMFGLIDIPLPQ